MLTRLTRALPLTLLVMLLTLPLGMAAADAATPGGGCTVIDKQTGQCWATGTIPGGGSSGGGTNVSGGGGGGGGGPQPCISQDGSTVPCTSQWGNWSYDLRCWLQIANPQPPQTEPVWQGHTGGVVYNCTYPNNTGSLMASPYVWFAAPIGVNPAAVAQQIVATMNLHAINIGITPEPGAGRMGYVGLPTYLWVDQPAPDTYGPITRSATQGGVTVTVTAQVQQIHWSMGDGHTVTCNGPGTPYQDSYKARPSPTCGYTYTRAKDPYTVTATSHWVVNWAGGGQTGTIPMDLTATTQIRVGEVQVLVQ